LDPAAVVPPDSWQLFLVIMATLHAPMLTARLPIGGFEPRSKSIAALPFALALLAFAVSLVNPASSWATPAPGALSQLTSSNCVSEEEVGGTLACTTLVPFGLSSPYEIQLSPDSKNAYSVALNGALIEYSRNQANGALSVIGCVTSAATECAPKATNETKNVVAMTNPAAIALSPEGNSAYVVTQGNNDLVEFSRDPETGLLTEIGCISHENTSTCAAVKAKGLNDPYGVTVSPDGKNVYVASFTDEAVAEFSRNSETGALSQLASPNDCISSGVASGCGVTNAIGLKQAIGVIVSPGAGTNVYVAAGGEGVEGSIASFKREPDGALTQLTGTEACISTSNAECLHGEAINGPEDLAISPDGKNVYATSYEDNSIIELSRELPGGGLTQLAAPNGCVTTEHASVTINCSLAKGIQRPRGVAISPEGDNLYASGSSENAEAAFARNAAGVLTQLESPFECVTDDTTGCGPGSLELVGLQAARRVTVSPDATNVYVAGESSHAIVELARAAIPTVSGVTPSSGPETGGTAVTITGKGFISGATVSFGSSPASSVTVNSASSITATSPAGSGTTDVTVTTSSGISTTTPADRFTYAEPQALAGGTPGTASVFSPGVLATPISPVVPPPELAVSGDVAPVSGTVLVRLPGAAGFVPLSSLQQIPFGSIIDAANGTVSVTSALPGGGAQTGQFFSGEFILKQSRNGQVIAVLTGGNFSVCPTAKERSHVARSSSAHASGKHVVRKLWANAHGKFSTKGNYAAAAVQGTEWLTEDLCEGTLIKVTRDEVAVTNLVNHRHVEVKTGHQYLAKAP